jgi:hypothetical protein
VTVISTGNIYISTDADYQTADYQTADYQATEGADSRTDLERLVDALETVGSLEEFSEVAGGREASMIEDAIAFASTQSKRKQLAQWHEELQAEAEHHKRLANALAEAVSAGAEAVRRFISRLELTERWTAVVALEQSLPEVMSHLIGLAPDWSELLT